MGPADCGRRQVLGLAVSWWTWELGQEARGRTQDPARVRGGLSATSLGGSGWWAHTGQLAPLFGEPCSRVRKRNYLLCCA